MKCIKPLLVSWSSVLLILFAATANAQLVRYATDFPDATGWTLDPACPSCVQWAVDATPALVLGTPSARSAPNSLNFNDGVCFGAFACVGISQGRATSPAIDVSAPAGTSTLSFWCMWDTEPDGACYFDRRFVQVSNDGFQNLLLNVCYDLPVCGPAGVWHNHTLALQPAWGNVEVRYSFHSWDGMLNDGAGWFIDDFAVYSDCVAPVSYCTAKLNSQGCMPVIHSTGYPSATQALAFRIRASHVLNNKAGILFYGYGAAATPFQGGTLCVQAPIQRVAPQQSGGNPPPPDCSGTYAYDFNERIRSGVDPGLVPGEDVYAQYWSRDPQSPSQTGLTDGLVFVICP